MPIIEWIIAAIAKFLTGWLSRRYAKKQQSALTQAIADSPRTNDELDKTLQDGKL